MRQTPTAHRLLLVLLVLTTYHGSLMDTSPSSLSPSPSPASLFSVLTSQHDSSYADWATSWWSSWSQLFPKGKRTPAGAAASPTCVMNPDQRRLMLMLNELHTIEELNHGRMALQQIWERDNHNLTGVCPSFRPSGEFNLPELEHQSLCPWTLEQNNRPDRIPRLLWYARCLCGHCRTSGDGNSARLYSCVPLYHRVSVIWEVCQDGAMLYSWGHESVPVGCVCAHPSARRVP